MGPADGMSERILWAGEMHLSDPTYHTSIYRSKPDTIAALYEDPCIERAVCVWGADVRPGLRKKFLQSTALINIPSV